MLEIDRRSGLGSPDGLDDLCVRRLAAGALMAEFGWCQLLSVL
jgi:hypothetical protein